MRIDHTGTFILVMSIVVGLNFGAGAAIATAAISIISVIIDRTRS